MADTKINDLVALTTPVLADVVAIVDDTTGTPVTKKISLTTLDTHFSATTQTLTNKTLTSPVLDTSLSGTAFLDEDAMGSDSATKVASQQSIKKYVDNNSAIMRGQTPATVTLASTLTYEQAGTTIVITDPGVAVDIFVSYTGIFYSGNVDANTNAYSRCSISVDGGSNWTVGQATNVHVSGGVFDKTAVPASQALNNTTPSGDIHVKVEVQGTKSSGSPGFYTQTINVIVVPR